MTSCYQLIKVAVNDYYTYLDVKKHHEDYESVKNVNWVEKHGFYLFIHFQIGLDKYTNGSEGKKYVKHKDRDIFYAAHIDWYFYQYYGKRLNDKYNVYSKHAESIKYQPHIGIVHEERVI